MTRVLSNLLADFLSAIFFFAVYGLTRSIIAAIAAAIGAAQFDRLKLACRAIEPMQWLSVGLVVMLGGATLLTRSPRVIMLKPSVVQFAVAAVMLRRGWMNRYLPVIVRENVPEVAIIEAGYAWAGLLAILGATNLVIAPQFDIRVWARFIFFGLIGTERHVLTAICCVPHDGPAQAAERHLHCRPRTRACYGRSAALIAARAER
jgi:intracellular septation protein